VRGFSLFLSLSGGLLFRAFVGSPSCVFLSKRFFVSPEKSSSLSNFSIDLCRFFSFPHRKDAWGDEDIVFLIIIIIIIQTRILRLLSLPHYSRKNAFLLSRKRTLFLPRSVSAAQNISENNAVMTTKTTFNEKSDDDVNNGKEEKKNATKSKTFTLRPKEKHGMNRKARYVTLHFLRHAEGTHNVSREYNDPKHKDARLTDFGIQQCEKLAKAQPLLLESKSSKKKMTVATSPMTRCVQTARLCFDKESHMITEKYVALEELRETVNYQCDIRRTTSELKEEFGASVDFSRLENDEEDPLWQYWIERCGSEEEHTMHRESASLYKCADRARKFFEWVVEKKADTEEEIIVSSHSAFLRCVFNYGHTQEKFEYHMGGSEQVFDDREDKTNNVKVVQYLPEDGDAFEEYMRRDYENCELRSAVLEIL
jgi:broad specificity phosphatase PhoE